MSCQLVGIQTPFLFPLIFWFDLYGSFGTNKTLRIGPCSQRVLPSLAPSRLQQMPSPERTCVSRCVLCEKSSTLCTPSSIIAAPFLSKQFCLPQQKGTFIANCVQSESVGMNLVALPIGRDRSHLAWSAQKRLEFANELNCHGPGQSHHVQRKRS